MNLSIEKDIKILNEIIETGWLISDFEQCTAIDACEDAITALKQYPVLDKVRAEIEQKIEQERFARSVFRGEEKDAVNAEQCTGSIFAYNNVIELIDKYRGNVDEI